MIASMRLSGPGPDGISIKLMKDGSNVLSPILSSLLNLSLTTGQYPNELKEAKISPIFKGGDATDMNNYRQISILNIYACLCILSKPIWYH